MTAGETGIQRLQIFEDLSKGDTQTVSVSRGLLGISLSDYAKESPVVR